MGSWWHGPPPTGHKCAAVPGAANRGPGIGTVCGMRVLVVDDEVDLAEAVAKALRREGYAVDVAFDGDDALEKATIVPYDLVCLDRTMPGTDGLEVCRRLRVPLDDDDDVPRVLMLTARDSLEDRVDGLDAGADDYLVKPFELPELTARVRALLRRDAGRGGAVLEVGRLRLDDARHQATRDGQVLELTAKELSLLRYFMAHVGEVLSQEHLLEHVWDEHTDPFTNTVKVTVGTLRRKLAAVGDDQGPIETVVGSGYRLAAEG